jgi:hypothetical protein
MSQLILAVFFPRIVSAPPLTMTALLGLVVIYLVVSWLSAREEQ